AGPAGGSPAAASAAGTTGGLIRRGARRGAAPAAAPAAAAAATAAAATAASSAGALLVHLAGAAGDAGHAELGDDRGSAHEGKTGTAVVEADDFFEGARLVSDAAVDDCADGEDLLTVHLGAHGGVLHLALR